MAVSPNGASSVSASAAGAVAASCALPAASADIATGVVTASEAAIRGILDSMDIEGLSEKYCVSLKQSLFLAFLYLMAAVVVCLVLSVFGWAQQVMRIKIVIITV
jgi:hypothetical protein